jgi:hypothetical protein
LNILNVRNGLHDVSSDETAVPLESHMAEEGMGCFETVVKH